MPRGAPAARVYADVSTMGRSCRPRGCGEAVDLRFSSHDSRLRGARTDDDDTETTTDMDEAAAPRRRRAVAVVVGLILLLTGVNQRERPRSGAAGRPRGLVKVDGGHRMHVYSRAEHPGEPTLVFLAGMGLGSSYYELKSVWEPLLRGRQHRDRGLSRVRLLRLDVEGATNQNVATEVHDALHGAGVQGPYVLVAHSIGGLYGLEFAELYPDEVAGSWGWTAPHPARWPPRTTRAICPRTAGWTPGAVRDRRPGAVDHWINGDDSSLPSARPRSRTGLAARRRHRAGRGSDARNDARARAGTASTSRSPR